MTIKYFQNPANQVVYGYDDVTQASEVATCAAAGWNDVTATWPPAPSAASLAASGASTILAAGLAITSSATPALNGTYACDQGAQQFIVAETVSLLENSVFTDGSTAKPWPDASGAVHTFTPATWKSFAAAIAAYVDAVLAIEAENAAGADVAWPSASATIP